MILAQYVMLHSILGRGWDEATRAQIVRHFRVTRTPEGGWGLHRESPPYVFVTTLSYVALRLLGLGSDHELTAPARKWLRAQPGGVLAIPSWGKFWLAVLGLYQRAGLNPCPPELVLLPRWLPFHPSNLYCHTRYIYLAMACLTGCNFRAELGPIAQELRTELYGAPFESIDFAACRRRLAPSDVHVRPSLALRLGYRAWEIFDWLAAKTGTAGARRQRALDHCFQRILYEQRASQYRALSPVNGLLNCLAIWSRDRNHPELAPSLEGLERWKWEDAEEGIRYAGARSHNWDTAFAVKALLEWPEGARQSTETLRRAYRFLRDTQMNEELPDFRTEGRDPVLGGWCFDDSQHRWPVSDCTAEALCAILEMHQIPELVAAEQRLSDEHLRRAVEFILSRQNADGGFSTYERRRGPLWLERFNPSEMFSRCMTELSYAECTSSSVRALARYRDLYPESPLAARISDAIARGVRFLRRCQQRDGSFPGSWGIHFTYATFFVVEGLRAAGVPVDDPALKRAAAWLVRKQRPDGGWGEHYSACLTRRYVEHAQSQVVMSSWALLALLNITGDESEPVTRGIAWLEAQQRADGSWPRQAVNGVFFGSAMLEYRLYRSYFPAWALARHARLRNERRK